MNNLTSRFIGLSTVSTCLLGLSVNAPVASAQIVSKGAGYQFQLKYKAGQVFKQQFQVKSVGAGADISQTKIFTMRVLSVSNEGITTMEVSLPEMGTGPNRIKAEKQKLMIDKFGRPVGKQMGGYAGTFAWPDKPVKIGEKWAGDANLAGNLPLKATYTFNGFRQGPKGKEAVIGVSLDLSSMMQMRGTGTMYVQASNCQLNNFDILMTMDVPPQGGGKAKKATMSVKIKTL